MAVHHFGEAITAYRLGRALRHLDLGTKNPLDPVPQDFNFRSDIGLELANASVPVKVSIVVMQKISRFRSKIVFLTITFCRQLCGASPRRGVLDS